MTTLKTHPPIRIYGLSPYDRSAKVRWLLTEMGVAFENRWLSRETKEYESPEYLKINPMGRVPAVEIGDLKMFESSAICAYLADLFIEKGMAPELTSPHRAAYQQWMYLIATTIDSAQQRIMIIEDIPAGEIQVAKEGELRMQLRDALGALDKVFAESSYLVANRFSAADICLSYHLYFCRLWPELDAEMVKFPRITEFQARMEKMPSAVSAKVFTFKA